MTQDYESPLDDNANNTYVVDVRATDAAGNTALQTITVTVTNVAGAGATGTLSTGTPTTSTVPLIFTDAPGATSHQYEAVLSGGSFTGTPTGTLPTDKVPTGLTAGTAYDFKVRGASAEGNGPWSNSVTAATAASGGGGGTTAPAFRSVSRAASSGNVTPALPTGWAQNDILLLLCETASQVVAAPTGYTELPSSRRGRTQASSARALGSPA